jgi:hypothetical protein
MQHGNVCPSYCTYLANFDYEWISMRVRIRTFPRQVTLYTVQYCIQSMNLLSCWPFFFSDHVLNQMFSRWRKITILVYIIVFCIFFFISNYTIWKLVIDHLLPKVKCIFWFSPLFIDGSFCLKYSFDWCIWL